MKKLYVIAALAAFAATALAAAPARMQPSGESLKVKNEQMAPAETMGMPRMKAPARVAAADIAGTYTWEFMSGLQNQGAMESELVLTVVNEETGEISLSGPFPYGWEIKGTFDASSGVLSLPNGQYVGSDSDGDVYFYVKDVDMSTGQIMSGMSTTITASEAEFDDGYFVFPDYDIWAIGDYNNEDLGFYLLGYGNIMQIIDDTPEEGWETAGTAQFVDGWIISGMQTQGGQIANPADYPWQVSVQRSVAEQGVYRIVSPYAAADCPFSGGSTGYIEFSIEDPEFVVVFPGVYSGYTLQSGEKLQAFNPEGFYAAQGYTKDEIIEGLELTDVSNFDAATNTVHFYNCVFSYPGAEEGAFYTWQTSQGVSLAYNMVGSLKLNFEVSGLTAIDAGENGEAEYYSLQGIRVSNPENGQLVIRRAGGKSQVVRMAR